MIIRGFRFGMMLQLSLGPMCLMVFNVSGQYGFLMGLVVVAAIALADTLFIALAGLGAAAVMEKPKIQNMVKIGGSIILAVFGVNIILGAFDLSLLPSVGFFSTAEQYGIFLQAFLLTAASPLTIIFWAGVFTAEAADKGLNKIQLFWFAVGCICSTLAFETFIALLGSLVNSFLPQIIIRVLNVFVGLAIIGFGARLLLKKENK